jgi:hypothetical protein
MFSDNVLTKLFLQHILSPVRGNTFQQQNYGSNYPFSGVNNFQYTTKNYPFYGVEVPSEVLQPQHHENISPQVTSWPLQTNTTGLSHLHIPIFLQIKENDFILPKN